MQNQKIQTSSQLFREAAGIDAQGTPAKGPCACIMCSAQLDAGSLITHITKDTFGESFNNKLDVHQPGDVVCGDCAVLWQRDYLMKYSKTYATKSGVYKLASNEDIQAFFLRPPEAPFVAIYNTRQQQHMIWRTPVSLSSDILTVRLDDEILHINRRKLIAGISAWQRTLASMKKLEIKGMPAYPERTLSSRATGAIREIVLQKITEDSPEGAADIIALKALRMGEWWAMTAMSKIDLDSPATWPNPIKLLTPKKG